MCRNSTDIMVDLPGVQYVDYYGLHLVEGSIDVSELSDLPSLG